MRADASPYICKPDPTNIYPLSLHDALPISARRLPGSRDASPEPRVAPNADEPRPVDLERRHALQRAQVALHHVPHRLAARAFAHRRPSRHLVALVRAERLAREAQLGDPAADLRARREGIRHAPDAHHVAALLQV